MPLALALDDLHWSSLSSWELLLHVARNLQGLPVVIVGGLRPHDMQWPPSLRESVGGLRRAKHLLELELAPLDAGELRALAEQILGQTDLPAPFLGWLHRRTQGNPYFAEEMLGDLVRTGQLAATLADPEPRTDLIPSTLSDLIENRLAGLSPTQLEALQWLAVAGGRAQHQVLERLMDHAPTLLEDLEEMQHRHLLQEVPSLIPTWAFGHPLVTEVVYQSISGSRRQLLHARMATVLESLGVGSEDLAFHYARAGSVADPNRALASLLAAADAFAQRHAYREAATHYQAALALMPPDRQKSAAGRNLAARKATCLSRNGELLAAVQVCVEAAAAPQGVAERMEAAGLHRQAGLYLWQLGRESEAMRHWKDALDLLAGTPPSEALVLCLQEIAKGYAAQGDQEHAREAAHRAMSIAEALGSPALQASAASALAVAYCPTREVEQGIAYARRAIELCPADNPVPRWYALVALADTAMVRGHAAELTAIERELSPLADQLRVPQFQAYAAYVHGWWLTITGAWPDADRELRRAEGLARRAWHQALLVRILALRGILHRFQGQVETATQIFREAETLIEQGHLGDHKAHGAVVHYYCLFALVSGQPPQVPVIYARLAPSGPGWLLSQLTLQALEAIAAFEQGQVEQAEAQIGPVLELAAACDQRMALGYGHTLLARSTGRRGDVAAARKHLDRALDILDHMPHPFLASQARVVTARELLPHDPVLAAELLEHARLAAEAIGAHELNAAARDLLKRVGQETQRPNLAASLGLTPREQEVLDQLLAGRSNKEIAANLTISVRTAEVHVQHLMQKLGVTSRTELVSTAYRMGLRG
jgi:DNA-binding CsgD family transcriptional regulator/tetratricopeptide (TPR) repeat protein